MKPQNCTVHLDQCFWTSGVGITSDTWGGGWRYTYCRSGAIGPMLLLVSAQQHQHRSRGASWCLHICGSDTGASQANCDSPTFIIELRPKLATKLLTTSFFPCYIPISVPFNKNFITIFSEFYNTPFFCAGASTGNNPVGPSGLPSRNWQDQFQ